jgi:hypothetical protein
MRIGSVRFFEGSRHDYRGWKESKVKWNPQAVVLADSGYQGIAQEYAQARTPIKKTRGSKLSPEAKIYNRLLAKLRVSIENLFARLKKWHLFKLPYRSRNHRRLPLRLTLAAMLYNLDPLPPKPPLPPLLPPTPPPLHPSLSPPQKSPLLPLFHSSSLSLHLSFLFISLFSSPHSTSR